MNSHYNVAKLQLAMQLELYLTYSAGLIWMRNKGKSSFQLCAIYFWQHIHIMYGFCERNVLNSTEHWITWIQTAVCSVS